MSKKYFITGISTGIGKTVTSAVLVEKLKADYWKPIQSGDLDQSDSLTVKSLISNQKSTIHPEKYKLTQPLSPHLSAKLDGVHIQLENLTPPQTENTLIIEGAGGLMVPLNEKELLLDLIKNLGIEVIVVSQNYLGSINHTLLTINTLKQNQIKIKGIIFSGDENLETQRYILQYTNVNDLGRIPFIENLSKEEIENLKKIIDSN
jgi:dethiobiotin synthetase